LWYSIKFLKKLELHNIEAKLIKINIKSKLTAAHNREKNQSRNKIILEI